MSKVPFAFFTLMAGTGAALALLKPDWLPWGEPDQPEGRQRMQVAFEQLGSFEFVVLEPGTFVMGSPDDEPGHEGRLEVQREIVIPRRFGICKTEITQGQYWSIVEPGRHLSPREASMPATMLSWQDAVSFCEQLSAEYPGYLFRLPTDAEWEYACRAGATGMYGVTLGIADDQADRQNGGDTNKFLRRARQAFNFNSPSVQAVAQFAPNEIGLFDMHGNVWEWCGMTPGDPPAPSRMHRPVRGGAWSSPSYLDCRSAKRAWEPSSSRKTSIGFRLVFEKL